MTSKTRVRLLGLLLLSALLAVSRARAAAPATVSVPGVGVSTIGWTWNLASGATEYDVISSTGGGNISGPILPPNNSFTLTGLSTNTAVTVTVVEYDGDGSSAQTVSTAYSGAAPVSATTLFGSGAVLNVVTLQWNANGNAPGTTYQVLWSTDSFADYVVFSTQSVAGATVTATIADLPSPYSPVTLAYETVSFMVQSLNTAGVGSGFDATVSTVIPTIPNAPVFYATGTFALGVSSIAWAWSPINAATGYQLFSSTGGKVSPLLGPNAFTYIQTGLTINTSYQNYVTAYGVDGFANPTSTNSAPAARFTLTNPTTGLTLLNLSTMTTSISALWGANSNPPGTTYYLEWWGVNSATTTWNVNVTTLNVTGLAGGGTIYFTVQSANGDGLRSGFDRTYYAVIPSTFFPVALKTIPVGFSGLVNFLLPTGAVTINIGSGTFRAGAFLSVVAPQPANVPSPGGGLAALPNPIVLQITAADGTGNLLEPSVPVAISVGYGNTALNGINPNNLSLASFDTLHQAWVALPTTRNVGAQTLTGLTPHLSLFQVMGVSAATGLSFISVGPNPLRPLANPGQLMTFRNLPAQARVEIFTYIGEKIADFNADLTGIATWNGRNRAGALVASGVYVVLVQGAGTQRVLRVAVEK